LPWPDIPWAVGVAVFAFELPPPEPPALPMLEYPPPPPPPVEIVDPNEELLPFTPGPVYPDPPTPPPPIVIVYVKFLVIFSDVR
jgi:hypothetical protein